MAELTPLDEKLAEVLGLAQAASQLTDRIGKLAEDDETRELLERMGAEAKETADKASEVADAREGRKTAIHDKARETKQQLAEMAEIYLGEDDVDELDGFEFLVMAEAGEIGHIEVLEVINREERDADVEALIRAIKPVQERHVAQVRDTTHALAAEEAEEEQ